jgi:membrane-associated phospholipid phosphatase
LAAVTVLAFAIGNVSIYFQIFGVAFGVGALYAALGAGARYWAIYVSAFFLFAQLRAHADEMGMAVYYTYPVAAEKTIFLGTVPTLWLQGEFYTPFRLGVLETLTIGTYISYFFVPHLAALALWQWDRDRFHRYLAAFIVTLYTGLAVSFILPTAPPWLAGETGHLPTVHQIIPEIIDHLSPGTYQQGQSAAGTNLVAAMPSLHAAVPWLLALVCWRYRWYFRWAAAGYALAMTFTIVYLGEHYFVDAVAGFVVAALAWAAVCNVSRMWDARRLSRLNRRRVATAEANPLATR